MDGAWQRYGHGRGMVSRTCGQCRKRYGHGRGMVSRTCGWGVAEIWTWMWDGEQNLWTMQEEIWTWKRDGEQNLWMGKGEI